MQIGYSLKACLGFLDSIPSITPLANMRDVLVEGGAAILDVVPLATDASLPAESKVWSDSEHLPCNLVLPQSYTG